jgi:carboxylesterase type B
MAEAVSLFFWHFALLLVCMASQAQAECLVSIAQGAVRGSVMTSFHGKDFCSYRGIPYAEPPVGERRFRVSNHLVWNNAHCTLQAPFSSQTYVRRTK